MHCVNLNDLIHWLYMQVQEIEMLSLSLSALEFTILTQSQYTDTGKPITVLKSRWWIILLESLHMPLKRSLLFSTYLFLVKFGVSLYEPTMSEKIIVTHLITE